MRFCRKRVEKMTDSDWYDARLELASFTYPWIKTHSDGNASFPFSGPFFHTNEQIAKVKQEFKNLFRAAASGNDFSFHANTVSIGVTPTGVTFDIPFNLSDPVKQDQGMIQNPMLRLCELIRENWRYIGLCPKEKYGCGKIFLKKEKADQEFHDPKCGNRARQRRLRALRAAEQQQRSKRNGKKR
jgi:hypothetical protein